MISVESKIRICEVDGSDCEFDTHLTITSHWNREDMVVIETPGTGKKRYTVVAADLHRAVTNATNTGRFI